MGKGTDAECVGLDVELQERWASVEVRRNGKVFKEMGRTYESVTVSIGGRTGGDVVDGACFEVEDDGPDL